MFGKNKKDKFEDFEYPNVVEISGVEFIVEVVFSKKRSSSVAVKENKLVFRMSSYLTKKQAYEHFSSLLKSMYSKLSKREVVRVNTINDVLDNMGFYFASVFYRIEYVQKLRGCRFEDNVFYINPRFKIETVEKFIISKLMDVYLPRIVEYVNQWNAATYGYRIGDVSLKLVNSKWGHCTYDNKIMLNLKLLNAPVEVLNYVVVHELAHVKHKNHSAAFWNEVARFCPNYKMLRKSLKNSPPGLYVIE